MAEWKIEKIGGDYIENNTQSFKSVILTFIVTPQKMLASS